MIFEDNKKEIKFLDSTKAVNKVLPFKMLSPIIKKMELQKHKKSMQKKPRNCNSIKNIGISDSWWRKE